MANVLNIENLYVSFDTYAGEVQAVRGVSYFVNEGEVLAVVGPRKECYRTNDHEAESDAAGTNQVREIDLKRH